MMTLQTVAHGQFKRLRGARARKALAKALSLHDAHTERSLLLLERITRCGSWYRTEWSPVEVASSARDPEFESRVAERRDKIMGRA